jgi:hypothetical protein
MSNINAAWVEHQRKRWRWLREDAHRFLPPGEQATLRRASKVRAQSEPAADLEAWSADFERLRWQIKDLRIELALRRLRLKYGYNPDQPRDEQGRWTDSGGSAGRNDPLIRSDAEPSATPNTRYAQDRPRSPVRVRIGDRTFELEGGQAARLVEAQARADSAIARVRELDPIWRPTPSLKETVEGTINAYNAEANEAQARASELAKKGIGPGPFAGESIPARGPERNFTAAERSEINRIGAETGCHTCGTKNPGTTSENFVLDHQAPNALTPLGRPQRLYPQCISCSDSQGGSIRALKWGK